MSHDVNDAGRNVFESAGQDTASAAYTLFRNELEIRANQLQRTIASAGRSGASDQFKNASQEYILNRTLWHLSERYSPEGFAGLIRASASLFNSPISTTNTSVPIVNPGMKAAIRQAYHDAGSDYKSLLPEDQMRSDLLSLGVGALTFAATFTALTAWMIFDISDQRMDMKDAGTRAFMNAATAFVTGYLSAGMTKKIHDQADYFVQWGPLREKLGLEKHELADAMKAIASMATSEAHKEAETDKGSPAR
ncbi:MAG: hypothetical protein MRY32_06650 [Rickettsiales bacterium]|nr:hypothetical protein [Rickettsiales bacterium]